MWMEGMHHQMVFRQSTTASRGCPLRCSSTRSTPIRCAAHTVSRGTIRVIQARPAKAASPDRGAMRAAWNKRANSNVSGDGDRLSGAVYGSVFPVSVGKKGGVPMRFSGSAGQNVRPGSVSRMAWTIRPRVSGVLFSSQS